MFLITEYKAHYPQPVSHEKAKPAAGPAAIDDIRASLAHVAFLRLTKRNRPEVEGLFARPSQEPFQQQPLLPREMPIS